MSEWKEVISQADIDELLRCCCGFHDTCIVSANYKSGAYVDEKNAMCFGTLEDRELTLVFHGQWSPKVFELCFTGVRQFCVAGWQNNYTCEILDAYLQIYEGIWAGEQARLIVWADAWSFDISKLSAGIKEPVDTYAIARALKWRMVEKNKDKEQNK